MDMDAGRCYLCLRLDSCNLAAFFFIFCNRLSALIIFMLGVATLVLLELPPPPEPLLRSSPLRPLLPPSRSLSRSRPELEWVDEPVFDVDELLCFDDELDFDLLPPLLLLLPPNATDDDGAGTAAKADGSNGFVVPTVEMVAADLR